MIFTNNNPAFTQNAFWTNDSFVIGFVVLLFQYILVKLPLFAFSKEGISYNLIAVVPVCDAVDRLAVLLWVTDSARVMDRQRITGIFFVAADTALTSAQEVKNRRFIRPNHFKNQKFNFSFERSQND